MGFDNSPSGPEAKRGHPFSSLSFSRRTPFSLWLLRTGELVLLCWPLLTIADETPCIEQKGSPIRQLLRRALIGEIQPLFGNALWLEYQDLLGRDVWGDSTTPAERLQVLAALAQKGRWVTIYYGWRPNLPDEADNHLVELALAGGASAIVTHNVRDMARGELRLGDLRILTPAQCLEELE